MTQRLRAARRLARPRTLAVLGAATALLVVLPGHGPGRVHARLVSITGPVGLSLSKSGAAILAIDNMVPGQQGGGTVTLSYSGGSGPVTMGESQLVDTPAPGGPPLSKHLVLDVTDISSTAHPISVYDGALSALQSQSLGTWQDGDSHTYRFTVTFPDGGMPPSPTTGDNAYQGSAMSVDFTWGATAQDDDTGTGTPQSPAGSNGSTDSSGSTPPTLEIVPTLKSTGKSQVGGSQAGVQASVGIVPARACISRRDFVIHLFPPRGGRLISATVHVGTHRFIVIRGRRLHSRINLRGYPAGVVRIVIVARTRSGRRMTGARVYHLCSPQRLPGSRRLGL